HHLGEYWVADRPLLPPDADPAAEGEGRCLAAASARGRAVSGSLGAAALLPGTAADDGERHADRPGGTAESASDRQRGLRREDRCRGRVAEGGQRADRLAG